MALKLWLPLIGNTNDYSINTKNGTPYNVQYNKGIIGDCFENDSGLERKIIIPNSPHITGTMAIMMWLYPTDDSIRRNPFNQTYGGEGAITHEIGGKIRFYYGISGYNSQPYQGVLSNNPLLLNQWNHITLIRDLEAMEIIWVIDGNTDIVVPASYSQAVASSKNIIIGDGYTSPYPGRIADFRLLDHRPTQKEINEVLKAQLFKYTFTEGQEPTINEFNYPRFNTSSTSGGWNHWGGTGHIGSYGKNLDPRYIYSKDQLYSHWIANGSGATRDYLVYQYPPFEGGYRSIQAIICMDDFSEVTNSKIYPTWNNRDGGIPLNLWTSIEPLGDGFYLCKAEGFHQDGGNDLVGIYIQAGYKAYISQVQVEQKQHCTPFTFSNRSGKIYDLSNLGRNINMNIDNTPKWQDNNSYKFYKTSNILEIPFGNGLSTALPLTINLKVKPSDIVSSTIVFSSNTGSNQRLYIGIYNGKWDIGIASSSWGNGVTNAVSNKETRVKLILTGTQAKLYIDGQLSLTKNYTPYNLASNFIIGNLAGQTAYQFIGEVSYVEVCRSILKDTNDSIKKEILNIDENNGDVYLYKINEKNIKDQILDYTIWDQSSIGSVGMFGNNGSSSENYRIIEQDPFGKEVPIWEARPDSVSGADGGWNTSSFPIDKTKLYRFSTWINLRKKGSNGRAYLGCHGYGSINGVLNIADNSNYTNPYFWSGMELPENTWVLIIGHIFPYNYTSTSKHPDSGLYTKRQGKIMESGRDYKWRPESTSANHRSYLYYCTDTSVRQWWCYPRVDICDGTEPTIHDLLNGYDSRNFDSLKELKQINKKPLILNESGIDAINIEETDSNPILNLKNNIIQLKSLKEV